mgnify:CR=1 FL=1
MRVYTKAGKDKNYKDKYTHVTLVEEDDKPEDGEEVELRRCESSQKRARTRTTRKGEEKQSLLGGWSMGKVESKRMNGSAGKRRKTCREDGASGAPRGSGGIRYKEGVLGSKGRTRGI